MALYFVDVTIASAFVARWWDVLRVQIVDEIRDNEPTPRVSAVVHGTP